MPQELCPRCGKSKQGSSPGSITQWIASCTCDLSVPQSTSAKLCPTCGKHIETGRAGSFTQWIFRSDLCSCARPTGDTSAASGDSVAGPLYRPKRHIDRDAAPLELDPDFFPTERYTAYEQTGKGAAGTVYLCFDNLLAKEVAVKCLHKLTPEQLVSFQSEARTTSSLNHPHVIKVFDFGATATGAPYMVMEYFSGTNLEHLLAGGKQLNPHLVLRIFGQVLDALEFAHANKFYHRDIKPSNILFTEDNGAVDVRVIDFGVALAKQATQEPTIVDGQKIAGTPLYMAPDQAKGLAYTESSEIYAIGCVLFECLTGSPPFRGETPLDMMNMHANNSPPDILDLIPEAKVAGPDNWLYNGLSRIINRCLKKAPEERFASIAELSKAMHAMETENLVYASEARRQATRSSKRTVSKTAIALFALVMVAVSYVVTRINSAPHKMGTAKKTSGMSVSDVRVKRSALFNEAHEIFFDRTGIPHYNAIDSASLKDEDLACFADPDLPLINLNLSGCSKITGEGLKYLEPSKVQCLDLSGTAINSHGCAQLARFASLQQLGLEYTSIKDDDLQYIQGLQNLMGLHLSGCKKLTDAGLVHVAKLKNLSVIGLERSNFTDIGCEKLAPLHRLTQALLDDLAIGDEGVLTLVDNNHLVALRLGSRKITSKSLQGIAEKQPGLSHLALCFTSINPADLKLLRNCPNLVQLELFGTPLGESELTVISQLPNLEQLYISKLSCREDGLKKLYGLRKLRILDLAACNVSEKTVQGLFANLPQGVNIVTANTQKQDLPVGVRESMDMFLDNSKADLEQVDADLQ